MVASNWIPQFFGNCNLNTQLVLGSCQYAFSYFLFQISFCVMVVYNIFITLRLVLHLCRPYLYENDFCMQPLHKISCHHFSPPLSTPLLLTQNHRYISLSKIPNQDENCRHITIVP